jgi:hypothetical protein
METTSPFPENKDTTNNWYNQLTKEALSGERSIEELLEMLAEKPMVYIIVLQTISRRNISYTQEINAKVVEAMERYEQRSDIKELVYKKIETLLQNGKA